jgi:hypothetical protein
VYVIKSPGVAIVLSATLETLIVGIDVGVVVGVGVAVPAGASGEGWGDPEAVACGEFVETGEGDGVGVGKLFTET